MRDFMFQFGGINVTWDHIITAPISLTRLKHFVDRCYVNFFLSEKIALNSKPSTFVSPVRTPRNIVADDGQNGSFCANQTYKIFLCPFNIKSKCRTWILGRLGAPTSNWSHRMTSAISWRKRFIFFFGGEASQQGVHG